MRLDFGSRRDDRRAPERPRPGDKVVLIEVPPGLLDDLPTEDRKAISNVVGKPIVLNEYDDDGRAELEFNDADGNSISFM
jgi:hypothetical protein